jgi:DnaJ-domain-containing protein 1
MYWFWIILGLVYLVWRVDLIPDFLFPWGYIDDAFVLFLVYRKLVRISRRQAAQDGREQRRSSGEERSGSSTAFKGRHDPYETLGLSPSADRDEIRAAYLKLANQYHPDKVAHLGKEFQELAETRFKEIQQAYQHLTNNGVR